MNLHEKYSENPDLNEMASRLLATHHPAIQDATQFKTIPLLTKTKSRDYAGRCVRVPDLYRFKFGVDFFVLINQDSWINAEAKYQWQLLIHEYHHILNSAKPSIDLTKPNPPRAALLKHNGDFCEIPEHDIFSRDVYQDLKLKLRIPIPQIVSEQISKETSSPKLEP